jgi:hypothetical protein
MATKTKLLETRKRLLEDFEFWAKHSWKIRTKAGDIIPLVLNRVQKRFLRECLIPQLETRGYIRCIILKGRQQGLSTVVSAFEYFTASQRTGFKGLVIAHVAESSEALFDMYERGHEHMPELLKPKTKYSNKKELVFDGRDSGIIVRTAGGKGVARGETLQLMHLSEVAFWPEKFARDNFNSLIRSLPQAKWTACFVESTANGMSGQFYDLWRGAVAGENDFVPFFSAWFESDEYRLPAPPHFKRTPQEEDLARQHGLDDDQLYWRRKEVAAAGTDKFNQEYPCTADEAFLTSGRPVFDQHTIQGMLERVKPPLRRMAVEQVAVKTKDGKEKVDWRVVDNPRGELLVYHERDPNETYTIGADSSVGIKNPEKSDFCVAQVLDSKKRQVAVWRGQVSPDYYATVLTTLGYHYNIALLAPERNGHGLLVCVRIHKDMLYPNVFTDVKEGDLEMERETLNIGFQTSHASKPLIIDKLRGDVRTKEIEINDPTTLREMLSFIATESGKLQGEEGCYDDCVMALAIANHVHEGVYTPVEVTDDFYVQAI